MTPRFTRTPSGSRASRVGWRGPRRARAAGATAVGLALTLVTASCAGLPGSSTVTVGKAVDAKSDSEPLAVEPLTATSFDDPRQIATGFLRAQISSHDGYGAARTFLSGRGRTSWKPGSSVTVFDGASDIIATRPDTHTVRLGVPVVGTISDEGHLVRAATPTRRTLEFHVTQTREGWRIDRLPADLGVWMSDADVTRLYTPATVYYAAGHGRSLVPDPRLLPRQGLATALARAALAPAPAWLKPALATGLPAQAGLAVDAVPVRGGTAEVTLTDATAAADNPTRAALWASVTATLMQAPDVRAVTLRVGGSRLEAENLPATVTNPAQVGYAVTPGTLDAVVSRSGPYLAWTSAQASDAVAGTDRRAASGRPTLPAIPNDWSLLALGQGGRQVAAISEDRTSVRRWLNGTAVTVESLGTDLVRPAFDSSGWLWVTGHAFSNAAPGTTDRAGEDASSLWVLDTATSMAKGATHSVSVPWLGTQKIVSVSLAPEGSRILLTLDDGRRRHAVVAAVVRDEQGRPSALGPAHDVAAGCDDVKDAVWADATSVAVLATVHGRLQPAVQTIDDTVTGLGPVANASGLVSTLNGTEGLFVRTTDQRVFTRLGSSWSSFLTGGDVLAPRS